MPGRIGALDPRGAAIGMSAVATAYAVAAIVAAPRDSVPLQTYAGASTAAYVLDLTAGLALLAAGSLAWSDRRLRSTGMIAMVAGAVWFAPDWEGWDGGPWVVRSLGAAAAPFFLALLVHLTLGLPSGRVRGRLARLGVPATYVVAGVVGIGWALVRDPFADPGCWRNCGSNAFLVHADAGLASGLRDVWLRAALAIGVLLAAIVGLRIAAADPYERRRLLPLLAPGALVGLAEAAYAGALVHTRLEDPREAVFASIFLARAAAATGVATSVCWKVTEARRARTVVSRLVTEVRAAPTPGTLAERLAEVLDDARLEVAYWLPALGRYVDGHGRRIDPPVSGNGRTATPIVRGSEPIAVVTHDAGLLDGGRLEHEIGASARLAVDNERLHAEVLARLEELRASRVRIVETADAERRRLERDLHDGAQQRLLALSYDLHLACASAIADGEIDSSTALTSAVEEIRVALDQLRELAQGIYPAILTEAGLGPALATLADTAPVPVILEELPSERYPAPVEATIYVAVAEAISDAVARAATFVEVEARQERDRLFVRATDDGQKRGQGMPYVDDRVGALGGTLELGPRTLQAEIPCV